MPATLTRLVAWATDALDRPLARRDPRGIRTWIGVHDFRYLVVVQEWLNDCHGDDHTENPYGSYDSVVDLTEHGSAQGKEL